MGFKVFSERVEVGNKFENKATRPDGTPVTYYNLKVVVYGDSQIVGVPQDVYDKVNVGDKVFLAGSIGGLKDKYWRFDSIYDEDQKKK